MRKPAGEVAYEESEEGVLDVQVEEEEPTEEEQKGRHHFLVLFFLFTLNETQDRLTQLTDLLASGKIGTKKWADEFRREMRARHSEAVSIGRRLAGDMAPLSTVDLKAGNEAWDKQEEFFRKFEEDLNSGRYDDGEGLKEAQVRARSRQYGKSLGSTVTEAFRVEMGDEPLRWVLGDKLHCIPTEQHPYNCPDLSEEEPKPASQWDTAPKSLKQPCGSNCDCHFESVDGKYSTEGI